ncbi:hypothetical protein TanjilG_23096 [Lupinus angustifolius]|uniref:Uncharacterized protein n=1 Tax=Lupinus angustifolius TaxID=3871 RepID=A0A1J7GUP3_LUPAN|nr:hypothetical protein TanjilG_23096 [Lupinus angustifolius]
MFLDLGSSAQCNFIQFIPFALLHPRLVWLPMLSTTMLSVMELLNGFCMLSPIWHILGLIHPFST